MRHIGIEEKRITGPQHEHLVRMAVTNFALEHVKEFDSIMLEDGKDIGAFSQRDEIGLDRQRPVPRMAKELVLVAGPRSAPRNSYKTWTSNAAKSW